MTEAPLRILLLLRDLDVGGAQRQALLLARGLAARGNAVSIVTLYAGGALAPEMDERVRRLDLGKRGRGDVFGFAARLGALLRQEQPHVVYSFLTVPNLLTFAARSLKPRPLIVWGVRASKMEMQNYDGLSRLTHALEPLAVNTADLVVANAQQAAKDAVERGFPRDRIVVIPNGVDTARFKPDAELRACTRSAWNAGASIVIGHAARLDRMKDHTTFFEAMRRVSGEEPNVLGVCVVPGGERARDMLRADAGDVLIADDGGDLAGALNGFDLFCSSSAYGEAFSNVLAEALACGLPCVATRVGDAETLLGDAGEIAPPRDPLALAAAMSRTLARLRRDADGVRSRALARARAFSPDTLAEATETVIREAMARRR